MVVKGQLHSIGAFAFYNCTSLVNLTFPDSLEVIEESAFCGCSGLTSFPFAENLTTISGNAFANSGLTAVVIPDGVTTLGEGAFQNCHNLTTAVLGNGIDTIEATAFYNCSNLTVLKSNCITIGEKAFSHCYNLSEIELGNRLTTIGANAFYGCSSVQKIAIPSTLISVGKQAFAECYGLTGVYITDIAAWCGISFYYGGDSDFSANALAYAHNLYLNDELVTDLVIPDGVEAIKSITFYGCTGFTSVSIGKDVKNVGADAFACCENLKAVYITDIAAWCAIDYSIFASAGAKITNPLYYAHKLYLNNELVTDLVIPEGVTDLSSYSFAYCTSLTSVTIPDGVTTIENKVFCGCTNLADVVLPSTLVSIGSSAFRDCDALTSIQIPDGVTEIGHGAFQSCQNLMIVTLPASLTKIDQVAFGGCENLWHILYKGTQEQWDSISIGFHFDELENAIRHYNCTGEELADAETKTCELCANCVHTWDEGVVTLEPHCETAGEKTFTCTNCKQTRTEEMAATGHIRTHLENDRSASCAYEGYTGDTVCDDCGKQVSAGTTIPATGAHNYSSEVTAEPGCESTGVKTHTCIVCGDSYTEEIAATGHIFDEWQTVTEPTETTEGYEIRACLFCGATEERVIPALQADGYSQGTLVFCADGIAYLYGEGGVVEETYTGWMTESDSNGSSEGTSVYDIPWVGSKHKITAVVFEAGVAPVNTNRWFFYCTQLTNVTIADGLTTIGADMFFGCSQLTSITIPASVSSIGPFAFSDCEKLSKVVFQGDAPAFGEYVFHRMVANAYYPAGNETWTDAVKQDYRGEIVWVAYDGELPPVCEGEHTLVSVTVAPTCTEQGYTKYTCINCGIIYADDWVYATGHNYTDEVTEPTCTEKGYTTHSCANCGATYTSDEVAALGHRSTHVENARDATCGADGYTGDTVCDDCGKQISTGVTIPATGAHSYSSEVTTEPGCEAAGMKTHTCSVCGDTYTEEIAATGHLYEDGVCTGCGQPEVEPGDVNGDGKVNSRDARALLRVLAGLDEEDKINKTAADYNGDGKINTRDARAILRYLAGLD